MSELIALRDRRRNTAARRLLGCGASALALALASGAQAQATTVDGADQVQQPTAPTTNTQGGAISNSTDAGQAGAPAPDVSQGQPVPQPDATDTSGEDIVVTGIRSSLANAQNVKRNADTVVDAITAEDIGALPDRSVLEAIQRIPGVAITRFAASDDPDRFSAEGSGVVVRGLNFVRSEFNGRDAFSANGGRSLGFQDVAPELVGSVEVFKNLTADLIEGGIAGTINLNTRRPFDDKGQTIYLSAEVNYGDLSGKSAPAFTGLYSNQWETGIGRFGILGSATYTQLKRRADGTQVTNFQVRRSTDAIAIPGLQPGVNYYAPIGANSRTQFFDRERYGYSAAAQFESLDRSLLVTAQFLRSDARQKNVEYTYQTGADLSENQTVPAPGTSYQFDEDNVFEKGIITETDGWRSGDSSIPLNGMQQTLGTRGIDSRSVTDDHGFNVKWNPSERLQINLDAQYVKSTSRNLDFTMESSTFGNIDLDLTGDLPINRVLLPTDAPFDSYTDPSSTFYRSAMDHIDESDGEEWAFRGDVAYDFADGNEDMFLKRVKVGGRYADRDQTVRNSTYNWGVLSETWAGNAGGPVFMNEYDQSNIAPFTFPDFFRGAVAPPVAALFWQGNIATNYEETSQKFIEINNLWAQEVGFTGWRPLAQRAGVVTGTPYLPGEISTNSEATYAAYFRVDFGKRDLIGGLDIDGNVGLRYVRTKGNSTGFVQTPTQQSILGAQGSLALACALTAPDGTPRNPADLPRICRNTPAEQAAILAFANGAAYANDVNQSFDHWLPSVNVKVGVTDELLFRFAYSKAISRPSFSQLTNTNLISEFQATPAQNPNNSFFGFGIDTQGNPNLRPVEANQFDITAEWYFDTVGSLTVAGFYKELSQFITLDDATAPFTNNGVTIDLITRRPENTDIVGKIKGFEVAYQQFYKFLPAPLDGFGVQANYTYVDSSGIPTSRINISNPGNSPGGVPVTTLPLEGLSKHNFNAALIYEKGPLSTRLAYSWRSSYLVTARDVIIPNAPIFSDSFGQLDGSLFLTVNENFKIGAQVQNITNAVTKTRYVINADLLQRPRSFFINDRQFSITTRLKF